LAEVLRIRMLEGDPYGPESTLLPKKLFYVHYIDYNKRLDEWVTIERMKLDKIQPQQHQPGTTEDDDDDDKESVKSASLKNEEASGMTTTGSLSQAQKRKRKSR